MPRTIRSTRHRPLSTIVLVAVLSAFLLAPTATAAATAPSTDLEAEVLAAVNLERVADGLDPVEAAGDLMLVARQHSGDMADQQDLRHNDELGTDVTRWRKVGENVGRSPSVEDVHEAFMASPSHAANILEPDFAEIGVGVEVRDDTLWITQVFRDPSAPAFF